MIPTPSQPMKSCTKLPAVTKTIIVMRKIKRYLKNRLMWGSLCIYHAENSRMDHVIYSAIGVKTMEWKSRYRRMEA